MYFLLSCECGQFVEVTEGSAGASVGCVCGRSVKVPPLGELRRKAAAGEVVASEHSLSEPPPAPPSPIKAAALQISGGIVFLMGAGLLVGNWTGAFPTFPFAGYMTMGLGAALVGAGNMRG